jgi:hypothetical protein
MPVLALLDWSVPLNHLLWVVVRLLRIIILQSIDPWMVWGLDVLPVSIDSTNTSQPVQTELVLGKYCTY